MTAVKFVILVFLIVFSFTWAHPLDFTSDTDLQDEIRVTESLIRRKDYTKDTVILDENDLTENCNNSKNISTADPIHCNVWYHYHNASYASWSGLAAFTDNKFYLVIYYTCYATSFEEFVQLYPTVTIYTRGDAKSVDTFGEYGNDKFGAMEFKTDKFAANHLEYMINIDETSFGYYIMVQMGIGFRNIENKLYIEPFVTGYLRSHGAYTRYIELSLDVYTLTFNPKSNSLVDNFFMDG